MHSTVYFGKDWVAFLTAQANKDAVRGALDAGTVSGIARYVCAEITGPGGSAYNQPVRVPEALSKPRSFARG
jgi:hypothetical protein